MPFREEALWDGYPEETNAPYGVAKKALLVQCQAYREQYGMNAVFLLPVNLYGPRDNFDLHSSHIIPALIRKCVEAQDRGDREMAALGDGSPTREFLYVEDAAEAVVLATERYNGALPVNIGSGEEIAVRDLAGKVAALCSFEGSIARDGSKPNGQPRRCLDVSRAEIRIRIPGENRFGGGPPRDRGLVPAEPRPRHGMSVLTSSCWWGEQAGAFFHTLHTLSGL